MEIHTEVKREDFLAFQTFVGRRTPAQRALAYSNAALLAVPTVVLFIVLDRADVSLARLLVIEAIYVCALLAVALAARGILRNLPAESGALLGPRRYWITQEGLAESAPSFERLTRWHSIQAVEVDGERVYVLLEPIAGVIVPMRGYPTNIRAEFVDALRAWQDYARAGGR